jgi:hypothetical protein
VALILFSFSVLQVTSHHLLITIIIITISKRFVTFTAAAAITIGSFQHRINALLNFHRHQPQPCCCCTIPAAVYLPKQLAQTFAQRGQLHVELQPDLFAIEAFANVQCCCELLLLQEGVKWGLLLLLGAALAACVCTAADSVLQQSLQDMAWTWGKVC